MNSDLVVSFGPFENLKLGECIWSEEMRKLKEELDRSAGCVGGLELCDRYESNFANAVLMLSKYQRQTTAAK